LNNSKPTKLTSFEPYSSISISKNNFNSSQEEYLHRIDEYSQKFNKINETEDFWKNYEQKTHSWKQWISFMIPFGLKNEEFVENLNEAISNLGNINGVTLFPNSYLYLPISFIGFLKPDDVMWSQVESFYVNASPRLHRIDPFEISAIKIGMSSDALYIAFDDGYNFKKIRKQLMLGVPHINKIFKNQDSQVNEESDHFLPKIDIAYLNKAKKSDINNQLNKVNLNNMSKLTVDYVYLVRMASDPQLKINDPDIIAEIPLMGKEYRTGYHN
tara:strand:+ start:6272 stop:7084 length:813 start_codon:yes stop_codon:yes gene_type:complete